MTEREIFTAALYKADPAERAGFLDQQCAGNAPLRQRIESLLAEHQQLGSFMDVPSPGATLDQQTERLGMQIGPYKLLQQIGEGGMGTVYMAEQKEPVQRKVALKVIKAGMDSRQVIARFEAERQALAMMDHVNIARVLDAGATESGRPYFVMELVHGVPITKYCDDNRLTPRQRLELFVPVCHAIQHAHQKGIIHRDIKPSNVMITLYDGKPVPKVIDFGVAKATEQKLTERTLFTQYGTMVGTLEYMSPEQAEMSALGVDTRSDIFSLGVLLYELLTGSTPLSSKRMREAAYGEILRLIKEEEPPKPSTRLSESGEALASISAQRHTEPAKLSNLMRGELDWIVMKTLEKDRNRRYETAKDFASDVQRYLGDEPVLACPPSAGYRFRKFARRNRGAVLTAVAISAALLVGTAVASWEALRATRAQATTLAALAEKEQARAAEAEQRLIAEASAQQARAATAAEKKAKETIEAKELEARAVLDFVQNKVFAAARPKGQAGGLGHDVSLRQALEAALPFVEQNFTDQPLIEARLRLTLGESFEYLGEYKIAAEQFQAVRTIYAQHLGPDHISTLKSMFKLAQSYYRLGRYADQVKLLEERLALQKAKYGTEHPDTLWSMNILAERYGSVGRHADAIQIYEELDVLLKAQRGPDDDSKLLLCLSSLARSYAALGRHADAIRVYEEAIALPKAKLGPGDKSTLLTMNGLAESYIALGRRADAVKLYEELLPLWKARFGPDHFAKFETVNRQRSIDFDLKFGGMERNLTQQKAQLGTDHADTLRTMRDLAASYANFPDYVGQGETLKLRQQELTARKVQLGADHPDTLWTIRELAALYGSRGLHSDAVKLYEELIPLQKAKLGPDHPTTLRCMRELADRYALIGRHAEAVKLYEELLPLQKTKLGPDHPDTLRSMRELSDCYYTIGRHAETVKLYEELLPLEKTKLGPDHPDTLRSMNSLAWVLAMHAEPARRDPGRAVSLAKEAVELKPHEGIYCNTLGTALYRAGRWKDAIETLERADQLSAGKHLGYNAFFIAMAHWQLGDKDNARVWYDKAALWMEQNEPKSEELRRFRAEAEELMKVEKKKD